MDNDSIDQMHISSMARAQRLKRMRKMTKLSRKDFAIKHNFSSGTLQNWETARFGGLTEKGARLILKALRKEGVFCSYEWLMLEVGTGPSINIDVKEDIKKRKESNIKSTSIREEVDFFLKESPFAKYHKVKDDSMYPFFKKGDHVIGSVERKDASDIIGKACIIETLAGELWVRCIKEIHGDGSASFVAANLFSKERMLLGERVQVSGIYPIIWKRSEVLADA